MARMELRDQDGTLRGYVEGQGLNDLAIVSLLGDPVNVKFAAPEGTIGAFSGNVLRPDMGMESKVLFIFKQNEAHLDRPNVKDRGGEFGLYIHDGNRYYHPVTGQLMDDWSIKPVVVARAEGIWVKRLFTDADSPGGFPGVPRDMRVPISQWADNNAPSTPAPQPVPAPAPQPSGSTYRGFKTDDARGLEAYMSSKGVDISEDANDYVNGKWGTGVEHWKKFVDYILAKLTPTDPNA